MGPLKGYTIIEMAGIGPCPMAGMMFADMGAEVIRVERGTTLSRDQEKDVSFRGKKSIALNLKNPAGVEALLRLMDKADALIEGYRPGVAERLGFGPDVCFARNRKLVFGRMTGWGQDGPLAKTAGHDINYIAITGALHAIGPAGGKPVVPLNLVGDMGGGGMLLAFGVVCALLEAQRSGKGQVVDAAMIDGAALLMWMTHGFHAAGRWNVKERGVNFLDGGAHFYDTYETSDKKYVSIGAIEPQFYVKLIELLGVDKLRFDSPSDTKRWSELKAELTTLFKTKTRDDWCAILEGHDACFAPVLDILEAPSHPHNRARNIYFELDGVVQQSPAPRFSRTAAATPTGARPAGADGETLLSAAGYSADEIDVLKREGVLLK